MRTHRSSSQLFQGKTLAWRDVLPRSRSSSREQSAANPDLPVHPSVAVESTQSKGLWLRSTYVLQTAMRAYRAAGDTAFLAAFGSHDMVDLWCAIRDSDAGSPAWIQFGRLLAKIEKGSVGIMACSPDLKFLMTEYKKFVALLTEHDRLSSELRDCEAYLLNDAASQGNSHWKFPGHSPHIRKRHPERMKVRDRLRTRIQKLRTTGAVSRREELVGVVCAFAAIGRFSRRGTAGIEQVANTEARLWHWLVDALSKATRVEESKRRRLTWAMTHPERSQVEPPRLCHVFQI